MPARAPVGKAHATATARFTSAAQRSGQLRPALATANTNAGEPCQHLNVLPLEGACKCKWLSSTSILVWGARHDSCPAPFPTTLSANCVCDVERPLLLLAGVVKSYRGDLDALDTTLGQQDWQIPAVHGEGAENTQGPMTHADAAGGQYCVSLCICPSQLSSGRNNPPSVSAISCLSRLPASHALASFPAKLLLSLCHAAERKGVPHAATAGRLLWSPGAVGSRRAPRHLL